MDPIYCLRDSEGIVRYIGVTCQLPTRRLADHLREAAGPAKNHRLNWLRSLSELPTIEVIEWVLPMHRVERERYWIALFRDYGHNLVNGTDGGDGSLGYIHTLESRSKMRTSHLGKPGRPLSSAARKNLSDLKTGIPPSAQCIAASVAYRTGRPLSPETCRKMSEARTGIPHSFETRKKIGIAKAGRRPRNSTNQFLGVSWHKASRKWRARVRLNGTRVELGGFVIEEDAARAVDAFVRKHGLSLKFLNFPEP